MGFVVLNLKDFLCLQSIGDPPSVGAQKACSTLYAPLVQILKTTPSPESPVEPGSVEVAALSKATPASGLPPSSNPVKPRRRENWPAASILKTTPS